MLSRTLGALLRRVTMMGTIQQIEIFIWNIWSS